MKLLKKYEYVSEAEDIAEKLESKGIVTFISSKESNGLSRIYTGALKVGLWAVIKHQHNDAYKYIKNKNHEVVTGLSSEEMSKFKKLAKQSAYNSLNKFLTYFAVIFFSFIGIVFLLIKNNNGI
jgi:hypothetical protein